MGLIAFIILTAVFFFFPLKMQLLANGDILRYTLAWLRNCAYIEYLLHCLTKIQIYKHWAF